MLPKAVFIPILSINKIVRRLEYLQNSIGVNKDKSQYKHIVKARTGHNLIIFFFAKSIISVLKLVFVIKKKPAITKKYSTHNCPLQW